MFEKAPCRVQIWKYNLKLEKGRRQEKAHLKLPCRYLSAAIECTAITIAAWAKQLVINSTVASAEQRSNSAYMCAHICPKFCVEVDVKQNFAKLPPPFLRTKGSLYWESVKNFVSHWAILNIEEISIDYSSMKSKPCLSLYCFFSFHSSPHK